MLIFCNRVLGACLIREERLISNRGWVHWNSRSWAKRGRIDPSSGQCLQENLYAGRRKFSSNISGLQTLNIRLDDPRD